MAFDVNSVPLSETIMPGLPRRPISAVSSRHASAGNRDVGDRRQALPRHVVDDVQDAEAATAGELVVDKIQRPAGVGRRLDQDRRPRSCGAPTRSTLADREALFAIEAIDAVDPRGLAILPQ